MKILGIDEAGRGSVAGPLVMCGYLVDDSNVAKLKSIGVKDSKMLSAAKRESLIPHLKKIAHDYALLSVSAEQIDELRTVSNLNKMEIMRMQQLINTLAPDKAILDALEANEKKFLKKVESGIKVDTEIIAENFADRNYTEVGAASILAKVQRDGEIAKLHKIYGNFGSGYSSDPRTISYLKEWIKKKQLPSFVRKSWLTIQWIREEMEQIKINEFL